jgi:hypothetical protein
MWIVSYRRIRGSSTEEPRAKWHLNVSMDLNAPLEDSIRSIVQKPKRPGWYAE